VTLAQIMLLLEMLNYFILLKNSFFFKENEGSLGIFWNYISIFVTESSKLINYSADIC
jgi:hypothetical protein